jgi:hypothetical protein
MRVGGVYENIPENDEFKGIDFVAPFEIYLHENWARGARNDWSRQSVRIYALLNRKNEIESLIARSGHKLKNMYIGRAGKTKPVVFLQR